MLKTKMIALATVAVFTFAPMGVFAKDEAPKVSYSAKKQGKVAFENEKEDVAAIEETSEAETAEMGEGAPENIEPAAGGIFEEEQEDNSVAEEMKLPRK